MGEIAEMMLDGTLCQVCGELLGDDAPGHPRTCVGCAKMKPKPHDCQFCHRSFTTRGARNDHERAVHAKRLAKQCGDNCLDK